MAEQSLPPLPAAGFIVVPPAAMPHFEFLRCRACGTSFVESERLACGKCGAREGFDAHSPTGLGTLHSFSIVYRGFPGVTVPFVSAIVDLDDGPTLKGNLRGVAIDPQDITPGMRVKTVFDDALGRQDAAGNSYLSHFFEPAEASDGDRS